MAPPQSKAHPRSCWADELPSAVEARPGSGPQAHRSRCCKPSCLTRGGGPAGPGPQAHMTSGPRGARSDRTCGCSSSESLTFQQNFCNRKVLRICMPKENFNKGKAHIIKNTESHVWTHTSKWVSSCGRPGFPRSGSRCPRASGARPSSVHGIAPGRPAVARAWHLRVCP